MKKLSLVLTLASALAVASLLSGCGEAANTLKHLHSSFTGLHRTITLYNANGAVIQSWHTQATLEDRGGTCYFLDAHGKAVTISGTFVVQEN